MSHKTPLSDAALSAARKCVGYMGSWVATNRALRTNSLPCETIEGQWFADVIQQAIEEAVKAGQHSIGGFAADQRSPTCDHDCGDGSTRTMELSATARTAVRPLTPPGSDSPKQERSER